MGVAVGDAGPLFDLPGVDGATGTELTLALSALRGAPVVLAFYPADDSPVCTAQLGEYTQQIGSFEDLSAHVVAISPQSPESHRRFAAGQGGFAFPLLSDEDKALARSYGNLGLLDLYRRSTYVLDAEGTVVWIHRSLGPGLHYSQVDQLVGVLAGLV
jgi:peroxiredoxin Q/BCP